MSKWTIEGLDKARAVLGEFSWREFDMIHAVSVQRRNGGVHERDVDLILDSERRRSGNYRVHLRFREISDFKLTTCFQISGLTIENIADHQWERQNWQVGQLEDSVFSLRAAEVEVVSVTPL